MLYTCVHVYVGVALVKGDEETSCRHDSPPPPQDRTIAVWDMKSPSDIVLRRVLVGHRAAVNVVDFDDRYIVSASGDRTIKVRDTLRRPFSSFRCTLVTCHTQHLVYFKHK